MLLKYTGILLLIFVLSSCSGSVQIYDSPNFNPETGRFQHPDGDKHDKSFADMLGLARSYFSRSPDEWEKKGFPVIETSKDDLGDFSENVIWVGHATLLLNYDHVTVLTDPQFSGRASPFQFAGPKRVTPVPFSITDLPEIDIVIISHNHYDHLDEASIRQLARLQPDIRYLVPLGLAPLLRTWGAQNVEELDWWQPVRHGDVLIQPTPVQHWSKRTTLDRNKTLWAGWMLQWPDFSFYFAGDTGYSADFRETAKRLGSPTLAAIPIGAYEPRDFMKSSHVNPEEAVTIFQDMGARYAIGIHWGTFKLTLEEMNEPPIRLEAALTNAGISTDVFRALQHGEDWTQPFMK